MFPFLIWENSDLGSDWTDMDGFVLGEQVVKKMARKKIREYDSKRLLKEHFKRLSGYELGIKSAQVSTNF